MKKDTTYHANFIRCGVEYESRSFKTGRGCINFVRREWDNPDSLPTWGNGDGWYIVRRTWYFDEQGYRSKGVILAQSKDCHVYSSIRKFREIG